MEECIFCKIVLGEIPSYKIYEDENFISFLDINPIMEGQVLLIPKEHFKGSIFDLDEKIYLELMKATKKISNILDKTFNPIKVGMIAEGLELDHVHVKLYPLKKEFGLKIMEPNPTNDELKQIQNKILENN